MSYYATHSTLAVTFEDCDADNWEYIPQFSRALQALPHLHTLSVSHILGEVSGIIASSLTGHVFPAVKTLTIPISGLPIVRSCPNTTDLAFLTADYRHDMAKHVHDFLVEVGSSCSSLATLRNFLSEHHNGTDMYFLIVTLSDLPQVIAETTPNLGSISVTRTKDCAQNLASLASLAQLERIELHEPVERQLWEYNPGNLGADIDAAKKVLLSCAKLSGQVRAVDCKIQSIVVFDANTDEGHLDGNRGTCNLVYLK